MPIIFNKLQLDGGEKPFVGIIACHESTPIQAN